MSQFPSFGNAFAGTTTTYPRRFAGAPTPNLSYEDTLPAPQIYRRDTSQDAPMISSYPRVSGGRSAPIYYSPGPVSPLPRAQFTEGIRQQGVQTNANLTNAAKLSAPYQAAQYAANSAPIINQDTPADRQAAVENKKHFALDDAEAYGIYNALKSIHQDPETHHGAFVQKMGEYGMPEAQASNMFSQFSGGPKTSSAPAVSPNANIPILPMDRASGTGGIYSTPRGSITVNSNGGTAGGNFAPAVNGVPRVWNPTVAMAPAPAQPTPNFNYNTIPRDILKEPLSDSTQAINQRSADRDVQNRTAGRNAYVAGKQMQGDIATGLTAEQNQPQGVIDPRVAASQARLAVEQLKQSGETERTNLQNSGRTDLADRRFSQDDQKAIHGIFLNLMKTQPVLKDDKSIDYDGTMRAAIRMHDMVPGVGGAGKTAAPGVVTPEIAKQYLQKAGGDKDAARKQALADGYTF